MRIKLSHAQADPDLRFRPITKRPRDLGPLPNGLYRPTMQLVYE